MHPLHLVLGLSNLFFIYLVYQDIAYRHDLIQLTYLHIVGIYLLMQMVYFILVTPYADTQVSLSLSQKTKLMIALAKSTTIGVFALLYYGITYFIKE